MNISKRITVPANVPILVYKDENGVQYFAGSGLGGDVFMVLKRKPGALGMHRVKTKFCPLRNTLLAAQMDLVEFAEKHSLKLVEG